MTHYTKKIKFTVTAMVLKCMITIFIEIIADKSGVYLYADVMR